MFLKSTVLFIIIFHLIYACEKYAFKAKENVELQDHVITTIITPYVEICWDKCVWIMNCFTINARVNRFGMVECDLNNSSTIASPGSMVQRQGSQYYQMQVSWKFMFRLAYIRRLLCPIILTLNEPWSSLIL